MDFQTRNVHSNPNQKANNNVDINADHGVNRGSSTSPNSEECTVDFKEVEDGDILGEIKELDQESHVNVANVANKLVGDIPDTLPATPAGGYGATVKAISATIGAGCAAVAAGFGFVVGVFIDHALESEVAAKVVTPFVFLAFAGVFYCLGKDKIQESLQKCQAAA